MEAGVLLRWATGVKAVGVGRQVEGEEKREAAKLFGARADTL